MAFLKSGVTLEGSPLLVLEETRREGAEEVAAIRAGGESRAKTLRAQGRSALIGGFLSGAGDIAAGGQKLGALE